MAENGPITQTTFDGLGTTAKESSINELKTALAQLENLKANVQNCNCAPSDCCQSQYCQSCQTCQTCQSAACQSQSCQTKKCQSQCTGNCNCGNCNCGNCDCSGNNGG